MKSQGIVLVVLASAPSRKGFDKTPRQDSADFVRAVAKAARRDCFVRFYADLTIVQSGHLGATALSQAADGPDRRDAAWCETHGDGVVIMANRHHVAKKPQHLGDPRTQIIGVQQRSHPVRGQLLPHRPLSAGGDP